MIQRMLDFFQTSIKKFINVNFIFRKNMFFLTGGVTEGVLSQSDFNSSYLLLRIGGVIYVWWNKDMPVLIKLFLEKMYNKEFEINGLSQEKVVTIWIVSF